MTTPSRPCLACFVTFLIAGLGACNAVTPGDNDDAGASAGDPDAGADGDSTAPTVVSVSPADGATGLPADTEVIVRFSERMDRDSVEAAWTSTVLPRDTVSFSWNAGDDIVTVTPDGELPIAEGDGLDPDVVERAAIAFAIGDGAADPAGNRLDDPFPSVFSTLRRLNVALPCDSAMTQSRISNNAAPGAATVIYAGDTSTDLQVKAAISFELPALPAGAALERATLEAEQIAGSGTAYADLGALAAVHVSFDALAAAFAAVPLASLGVFSADDTTEVKSLDVTAQVDDDLANRVPREDRSQYRLQFATPTDNSGGFDAAQFTKASLTLRLELLID